MSFLTLREAFAYRLYLKKQFNYLTNTYLMPYVQPEGTRFISDLGTVVVNWPEQHYSNGVAKNKNTGGRYKLIVRAVKRLKFYLADRQVAGAESAPSYLIESLLYNVPDAVFAGDSYTENVKNALLACFSATQSDAGVAKWVEVNGNKFLFHPTQPWTRQHAYDFVLNAWYYVQNS